jgi:hypothetical protein
LISRGKELEESDDEQTYAMLAAPKTPNLRASFCFVAKGGLNADHTRVNNAAIVLEGVEKKSQVSN